MGCSRYTSTHRVATYNILSEALAEPGWFASCERSVLRAGTRIDKIKQQLQTEIDQDAVICLQELSRNFTRELHTFLSRQGYHLISSPYGEQNNGYMGVGLCFPTSKYELKATEMNRLSKFIKLTERHAKRKASLGGPEDLGNVLSPEKMGLAKNKANVMLSVRLKDKSEDHGKEFCVNTYHLPCAFRKPHIMTVHSALSVDVASKFALSTPFVLAGDFNITPDSSFYKMITTGKNLEMFVASHDYVLPFC